MADFILVDVSNTFTKVAPATRRKLGRVMRLPTAGLSAETLRRLLRGKTARMAVVASVVPEKNRLIAKALPCPVCWVGPDVALGIGIDFSSPRSIGADRLANAVACAKLYGIPAVAVDFGTAVTFDVISSAGDYIGGVIAPGLGAMTEYLHRRTALLPEIRLSEPLGAIGRTTRQAMLAGAVHGYRGLVREILRQICREQFPRKKPRVVATGGDARLISGGLGLFDVVNPHLTLEGLRLIGLQNCPAAGSSRA